MPTELQDVLARDQITLRPTAPPIGAIDETQAIEALGRIYAPDMIESADAYFVEVDHSLETRLPSGIRVWMLHVAGVERDATGPMPPDHDFGDEVAPVILETDMFAFLDASTGRHLATIYIGPEREDN